MSSLWIMSKNGCAKAFLQKFAKLIVQTPICRRKMAPLKTLLKIKKFSSLNLKKLKILLIAETSVSLRIQLSMECENLEVESRVFILTNQTACMTFSPNVASSTDDSEQNRMKPDLKIFH